MTGSGQLQGFPGLENMTFIVGQDNVKGISKLEFDEWSHIAVDAATVQTHLFRSFHLVFDPLHPVAESLQDGLPGFVRMLRAVPFGGLDPPLHIAFLGGKQSGEPLTKKSGFVNFIRFLSFFDGPIHLSIDLITGHIEGQIEMGNAIQSTPGTWARTGRTMFNRLTLKGFFEELNLVFQLSVDIIRVGHI